MLQKLEEIQRSINDQVLGAGDLKELDAIRVAVLGKKGSLTQILQGMKQVDPQDRPLVGKKANEVRQTVESALESRRQLLEAQALEQKLLSDAIDVTLPAKTISVGSQHVIDQIIEEIEDIFVGIGYRVYEGPQAETDYYNFTALNTPKDHPARSMQDTFYLASALGEQGHIAGESDVLLRSQTSGVQVHTMESLKPPIYMIAPGKVYRRDVADPSHLPQFTQIEGLVVDKDVTFGDLKGTLEYFVRELFGKDIKMRFRPHFFPFTEPSCEVDMSCPFCKGEGCRFCKGEGWIEILGAGMVDPNVFGFVDIDPEEYRGFAFGIGVERVACLRYDLPDLRLLLSGDTRFLRQF